LDANIIYQSVFHAFSKECLSCSVKSWWMLFTFYIHFPDVF